MKGTAADLLPGLFPAAIAGKSAVVEYEPYSGPRATEQVPLIEEGGIEALLREALPHAASWARSSARRRGREC